jgi:hypothetical protein
VEYIACVCYCCFGHLEGGGVGQVKEKRVVKWERGREGGKGVRNHKNSECSLHVSYVCIDAFVWLDMR